MNLDKSTKQNKHKELYAIYKFIFNCTTEEAAGIIAEIRCCHDNILVFVPEYKTLRKVETVSINGECIQLTTD